VKEDDRILERILEIHPSLQGKLRTNTKTGCVLYTGINVGGVEGNPLIYDRERNGKPITLRISIRNIFHNRPRNGKYIRMKCGVHNRHNPEHRYLSKTRYPHRKGVGSNVFQLSAEEVNLIRNYSYVHPIVLERIFKVTKHSIRQIQRGENERTSQPQRNLSLSPSSGRNIWSKLMIILFCFCYYDCL
jgi:hypothetical protein